MAQPPNTKNDLVDRIDALLSAVESKPSQSDAFVTSLGMVLESAVFFSEDHRADALAVLWYLMENVPDVFAIVTDDGGLTDFCTSLAEDALRVAIRERHHVGETIQRLLAAFLDDRDRSGRFAAVPEVLTNPKLPKWVRELAGTHASRVSSRTPEHQAQLTALVALAPKTSA